MTMVVEMMITTITSSPVVKAHLFKLLYMALQAHHGLRVRLGSASSFAAACDVAEEVIALEEAARSPAPMAARCDGPGAPFLTWYRRHRSDGKQSGRQTVRRAGLPSALSKGSALV